MDSIKNSHAISVLVRNRPGVMTHVAGLFARRGYNIDSVAVGTTDTPEISVITIMVTGDDQVIEQVTKQLYKLADVLQVKDMPYLESVTRELLLITIRIEPQHRPEVLSIIEVFHAKIVDMIEEFITIEVVGNSRQIRAVINLLKPYNIIELSRTGQIALPLQSLKN